MYRCLPTKSVEGWQLLVHMYMSTMAGGCIVLDHFVT
jgi:hypothetical protein